MNATPRLHNLGQSLWRDNVTRDRLTSGTLRRYLDELSVTGLTSNLTIFDHANKNSTADCSGPAPEPRTPRPRTFCTSRLSPPLPSNARWTWVTATRAECPAFA
jgi:hypothetical protein